MWIGEIVANGHRKGSAFERKIAKEVVKEFKKQFKIEQKDCWRSVLSGGHEMSSGDLRMSKRMEELFPYAVECKHYKKICYENFLLAKKNSKEVKWLRQTVGGTSGTNLTALLVMKANNTKILTMRWLGYDEWKAAHNVICIEGRFWKVQTWSTFLKKAVKKAKEIDDGKR